MTVQSPEKAIELLIRAAKEQLILEREVIPDEIIDCSVPILWFGAPKQGGWVTIGTNPSDREFTNGNTLLRGEKARLYYRPDGLSLSEYITCKDELDSTLRSYEKYFRHDPYSWFGNKNGGKMEAVLNGLGGSYYEGQNFQHVIHTDFMPFATKTEYSKLVKNNPGLDSRLMASSFAKDFINDTLNLLRPSLIILAGPQNVERYSIADKTYVAGEMEFSPEFPDARFEIGCSNKLQCKVLGLYFKPSEVMAGLGRNHGHYQSSEVLRSIGKYIKNRLFVDN